jgi:hypothetical protein
MNLTTGVVKSALEAISFADVKEWLVEVFGQSMLSKRKTLWLFSTLCDNFCLWNREMLTEKDFYDYFAEETISIGFVSTQKPEEPTLFSANIDDTETA